MDAGGSHKRNSCAEHKQVVNNGSEVDARAVAVHLLLVSGQRLLLGCQWWGGSREVWLLLWIQHSLLMFLSQWMNEG